MRGKEHLKEFASFDRSNCMVTHNMVHHNSSKEFHFVITVEKFFKKPLQRQVDESMRIKNSNDVILMNSGFEWRGDAIPRAAFTAPAIERKKINVHHPPPPLPSSSTTSTAAENGGSSRMLTVRMGCPLDSIQDIQS